MSAPLIALRRNVRGLLFGVLIPHPSAGDLLYCGPMPQWVPIISLSMQNWNLPEPRMGNIDGAVPRTTKPGTKIRSPGRFYIVGANSRCWSVFTSGARFGADLPKITVRGFKYGGSITNNS